MTNNLQNLLNKIKKSDHATDSGSHMHSLMQHIVIDGKGTHGDNELVQQILSHPNLDKFFTPASRTEVPIAGYVNGKFVSRRIDRMVIDHDKKTIDILDYKTDIDKSAMVDTYIAQIGEYKTLVRDIYPQYNVRGYILWTHDFSLQEI